MKEDSIEWLMAITIEEIQKELDKFLPDLNKAERVNKAAQRARTSSVRLGKLFKTFRKVSCQVLLKEREKECK